MRARLISLNFDLNGESVVTFRTLENVRPLWDDLHEKQVDISVKEFKTSRSLNANAMYWKYLGELARKLGVSNNYLHNQMIRQYGYPVVVEGDVAYVMIPDTPEAEEMAMEAETYHIKPTSHVKAGLDGVDYRAYILMRGTKDYNTEEFARVLDGLLQDCREAGIRIMTDREEIR